MKMDEYRHSFSLIPQTISGQFPLRLCLFAIFINLAISQNVVDRAFIPPVMGAPPSGRPYNPMLTGELMDARRQLMYPYNYSDFTDITSSKPIHDQPLPFRLPFFGFEFKYLYVQKDGHIAFNKGLLSYKWPLRFPATPPEPLAEEDPSMIAPFFSLQDIPGEVPYAGVYFKIVNIGSERNQTLKDRLIMDFREGMIGAADFTPKYAIIVTWRNMTFVSRRPERPLLTNTYQTILATDEIRTYVMFNYEKISWITHQDNYEGLKGTAAYIGFNAGNTTRTFEFRPYSQQPRISLMTTGGYGNGFEGRFFFQVDEEVWAGSCINKELDPNMRDRTPLTFFPRWGNMLGGVLVNVTGPCFTPTDIIVCKFENWPVKGIYRGPNHATCISPPVMYHGYVDLTLQVNDRAGQFLGRFYLQPPDVAFEDIAVIGGVDREEAPQTMTINWSPLRLASDMNTPVTISLWGYREASENYPRLSYIDILADGIKLGNNRHEMDLSMYRERFNHGQQDLQFGFIAVNLSNPEKVLGKHIQQSPVLWSRAMPLSWYFHHQWERTYGRNGLWKRELCRDWYYREENADRFATTTFRCPCTMSQAMEDRGRFSPDPECNIIDRKCDTFHRGALHCVVTARPAIGGAGQSCCYDDQGELLQTADTMYGGRPSRAYLYGKHPFKMRMMIPALSHWVNDVMPFFFCCKWQQEEDNSETCQMYNYWRTSQDCTSYQPPSIGTVYGDPHFVTYDGLNYTFNGKGEFVLTRANNPVHKIDIQARFEQVSRKRRTDQVINATALGAIAASDNRSSVVEFRIRPTAARWRYHMYVIVDDEYVHFWDESLRVQNFRGVTLYMPAGIQNVSHVIAMFDSGAGVEVMTTEGHMTAHVYLPMTYLNGTGGLFGHYSKFKEDDLRLPNNLRTLSARSSLEEIHRTFGMAWRVVERDERSGVGKSLFYHNAIPFSQYDDADFRPEFQMPPQLPEHLRYLETEMRSVCGSDSKTCEYDYIMTKDKHFARISKLHETWAYDLIRKTKELQLRCPSLPKPRNGRKTEKRYIPGTIVRFACDDGYRLVGYEIRRCRHDGLWSWGREPQCISNSFYAGEIAGISIGILLPILLIVLCTICCVVAARRRGKDHYTREAGVQPAFDEFTPKGFYRDPAPSGEKQPMASNDQSPGGQSSPGKVVAEIPTQAREADI